MLPLSKIRVLDLSNVLAGPFCGYQLACMGAQVVKIEKPDGGDLARSLGADPRMAEQAMGLSFVAVNAGKQSVALDLKHEAGRAVFLEMVQQADALIENFRPGVMKRLGLDFAELNKVNPRLVYCAISGFGQDGPWAERPAYDQIVQGLSGVMSITGDQDSAPLRTGFPLCDTIGGMTAAFALVSALLEQQSTGQGRMIDVSLLEATMASMGWVVSNFLNYATLPQPMGNENFTAAPSGTFQTADGLLNIAANEQKQFESLCDLLNLSPLKTDTRFQARQARKQHRQQLRVLLEQQLASKSAIEWERLCNERGIPAGCVMSVEQALGQAHLQHRGFVQTLRSKGSQGQALRITRPGFQLEELLSLPGEPPALGAHTKLWLERLGRTPAQIESLCASGAVYCHE